MYPLFFGLPSHLDHRRALSRVPCPLQQVLTRYLFDVNMYQSQASNSSHHLLSPLVSKVFFPLHLCLYFCFLNKIIYTFFFFFFRFHICSYCLVAQLCLTLCNPMDYSTPGFPVLHHLPEFAQTHVF